MSAAVLEESWPGRVCLESPQQRCRGEKSVSSFNSVPQLFPCQHTHSLVHSLTHSHTLTQQLDHQSATTESCCPTCAAFTC